MPENAKEPQEQEQMEDQTKTYKELSLIDVSEFVEKTLQKHSYVSWVESLRIVLDKYGYNFVWYVHENPDGLPYFQTDWDGAFVKVSTSINGKTRTQWHPVLTHTNKPIQGPDAMAINNAIQRCLAKSIALHGLALYLYAGEDLPPTVENPDRDPQAKAASNAPKQEKPAGSIADTPQSRKDKANRWIEGAVSKGLSKDDAGILFEASRVATKTMDYDYWDTKNVTHDQFVQLLNQFGMEVRNNLEKE